MTTTTVFAIELFQAPPFFTDSWKRVGVTYPTREAAQAYIARSLRDSDTVGPEDLRIVEVQS
jgi:hypothetical protein